MSINVTSTSSSTRDHLRVKKITRSRCNWIYVLISKEMRMNQEDDLTVSIEVHFELHRFEQLKARYPLEALLAADVWPNAAARPQRPADSKGGFKGFGGGFMLFSCILRRFSMHVAWISDGISLFFNEQNHEIHGFSL